VKFQIVKNKPENHKEKFGEHTLYDILEQRIMPYRDWQKLIEYCADKLPFYATATNRDAVMFLADNGIPTIKVCSRDLRNLDLIGYVSKNTRIVQIDTGGGSYEDIEFKHLCDPCCKGITEFINTKPMTIERSKE